VQFTANDGMEDQQREEEDLARFYRILTLPISWVSASFSSFGQGCLAPPIVRFPDLWGVPQDYFKPPPEVGNDEALNPQSHPTFVEERYQCRVGIRLDAKIE